jgi:hypothetical protein
MPAKSTKKTVEPKSTPNVYVITVEEVQTILNSIENNPLKYGIESYNILAKVVGRGVINGTSPEAEKVGE